MCLFIDGNIHFETIRLTKQKTTKISTSCLTHQTTNWNLVDINDLAAGENRLINAVKQDGNKQFIHAITLN